MVVERLSPAGDGAGRVEETCEKQKRSTWWMDVLVGGSGQGLFTWETKSSRSVTPSAKAACRKERVSVRGPCGHLQNNAERRQHKAAKALIHPAGSCRRRLQAICGLSVQGGACKGELAGHARPARRRLQRLSASTCDVTYGHLKGPLPTRKRAIGLV